MPRGWWHCVLNVDDTVAVTQNYVSDCNLADVLNFLRTKGEQVLPKIPANNSKPLQKKGEYPTCPAGVRLQPRTAASPDVCGGVELAASGQGTSSSSTHLQF